jgi:glycosyltransferase 2 family protein
VDNRIGVSRHRFAIQDCFVRIGKVVRALYRHLRLLLSSDTARRSKGLIGRALAVVALGFLISELARNWQAIAPYLEHARPAYLMVALVPTLAMQLLMSLGWTSALRWFGVAISVSDGFGIYYRSSIFRYLPGSLWYLPSRAYLCQQRGISLTTFARSVSLELLMLLTTGGLLGAAAIAVRLQSNWPWMIGLACLAVLVVLQVWPERLRRLFRDSSVVRGERVLLLAIGLVYLGMWFAYAVTIALLLAGLGLSMANPIGSLLYILSANTAAWLIGFLSPVPAGVGIREAALVGFFQPIAPAPYIIFVSLVQRMLELLLECCLWVVAIRMKRTRDQRYY